MNNHFQHTVFNIKQLNNRELLLQTKLLVQKERDTHIQVLRHLAEIDSRKLYFRQGFSSLFDYAVRELGYSEGAAYRRIKAMKLCRDLPETASRLQSGRLSLSVASQLQVFFEKQDKKAREEEKKQFSLKSLKMMKPESERRGLELEKEPLLEEKPEDRDLKKEDIEPLRAEKGFQSEGLRGNTLQEKSKSLNRREKESLMEKVEGCSSRIAGKLLSEADPSLSLTKKEKVRFLGTGQVEIKIVLDKDCHKNLEELKHLLSHKDPGLSYGKLLGILSKEALQKHDPRRKKTRRSISRTQATQGDVITENKKALISINKLADTKRKNLTSAPGFKNSVHHPSFTLYIPQKVFCIQDIFLVYCLKAFLISLILSLLLY